MALGNWSIPLLSSGTDAFGKGRKGTFSVRDCRMRELSAVMADDEPATTATQATATAASASSKPTEKSHGKSGANTPADVLAQVGAGFGFELALADASHYYLVAPDFFQARSWMGCIIRAGGTIAVDSLIERDLALIENCVTEVMYQRQRHIPIAGFTSSLLPYDPYGFSHDVDGRVAMNGDEAVPLESDWRWVGCWQVAPPVSLPFAEHGKFEAQLRKEVENVKPSLIRGFAAPCLVPASDMFGWEFATGFWIDFGYSPQMSWSHQVRRRTWKRTRVINEIRVVEARFDIMDLMLLRLERKLELALQPPKSAAQEQRSEHSSNKSGKAAGDRSKPRGFDMRHDSPMSLNVVKQDARRVHQFMANLTRMFGVSSGLLTDEQHLGAKARLLAMQKRAAAAELQLDGFIQKKNAYTANQLNALRHKQQQAQGASSSSTVVASAQSTGELDFDATTEDPSEDAAAAAAADPGILRVWGRPTPIRPYTPDMETDETRELDTPALVQLQRKIMTEQDKALDVLLGTLQRTGKIATAIGSELDRQNVMLADLSNAMDRTGLSLDDVIERGKIIERNA
ncbi:hypothetical protein CAOG_03600 [Capsaspora owczarzaki ATCC 30864]|uniref:t-SNARE coiled-coil homology domain-containing protein n=1 Tax=Capsaspora owczarzaki (strain ATCC 30864) TaxID=595528 RepID=A0A0D2WPP8_CAPO3|nr:hypothetical protein CAOG_03600 [Capsaspora owczarzaki ATCC 30864]KJE92683.1 hypothetical protein CAOG_003600 [Capsaspora owczarzaki ATCC 30864]|eukprot:XP_004363328.1 hypothetical protein CAOG_03600 [Capsaspora owczarzaki ATCC 30864]